MEQFGSALVYGAAAGVLAAIATAASVRAWRKWARPAHPFFAPFSRALPAIALALWLFTGYLVGPPALARAFGIGFLVTGALVVSLVSFGEPRALVPPPWREGDQGAQSSRSQGFELRRAERLGNAACGTIVLMVIAQLVFGADFGLAVASGGLVLVIVSLGFLAWGYLRARSGTLR